MLLGLSACAPVITTGDGERIRVSSADFREYAEQVFRTHNSVTTSMAYAIDDLEEANGSDEYREQLIDADDRMMQACAPLDEMVIARRDSRKVSVKEMVKTAELIPDCEAATRAAASMIPND